jgi:hypothetical protein
MLEPALRRKIEQLIRRGTDLIPRTGVPRNTQHIGLCRGWVTEALNVIEQAIPIEPNAYRVQAKKVSLSGDVLGQVAAIGAMLTGLLADADAGLLADFGNKIRAETFDDFLEHADVYRQEGQKQAAGVLAGVVFEDTIRRICRDKGIDEKGQDIDQLARQMVITGQQARQARTAAFVPTQATHAQWDNYDLDGVADTIRITRTLLAEHLGG